MIQFAALCSESYEEPDSASPTEQALFGLADETGTDIERLKQRHCLLSTHYRSEQRPYMSTYLDVAIGASVVAQLDTLFVPPLRRLLGATPITLLDAAVITGGALAPLFLNEWMKPGAAARRGNEPGRDRDRSARSVPAVISL